MRRSGVFLSSLLLATTTSCGIRYSFSGGGLGPNIRSMAVVMFENKTTSPDLQQEIFEQMRGELRRRLGVREAPQDRANAIVSGTIQQYQVDLPVGVSADPSQVSTRRRLSITIDIQIVDEKRTVLFEKRGLSASADYAERGEVDARHKAIELLVSDIVTGTQSQW